MESKSLRIIQKLAKVGKILSMIVFVCSIVGAAGCAIGGASLALMGDQTFKIGNVTIHGLIEANAQMTMGTIYVSTAVGFLLCVGEIIPAYFARRYFKNEIAAGTPFTYEGANELKRLGIITIVVPLVFLVLADVTYNVMSTFMAGVADMHIDDYSSVGLGIAFIIVSIIFRYGAELKNTDPSGSVVE